MQGIVTAESPEGKTAFIFSDLQGFSWSRRSGWNRRPADYEGIKREPGYNVSRKQLPRLPDYRNLTGTSDSPHPTDGTAREGPVMKRKSTFWLRRRIESYLAEKEPKGKRKGKGGVRDGK